MASFCHISFLMGLPKGVLVGFCCYCIIWGFLSLNIIGIHVLVRMCTEAGRLLLVPRTRAQAGFESIPVHYMV